MLVGRVGFPKVSGLGFAMLDLFHRFARHHE
jgi:hypothetical protein